MEQKTAFWTKWRSPGGVMGYMQKGPVPYVVIGGIALFLYLFLQPFALSSGLGPREVTPFMILLIILILGVAAWLKAEGVLTADHIVLLILAVGLVMRFGYCFYTGAYTRQHDMGNFEDNYGHYTYIYHYIQSWLPVTQSFWQYHHPPLYHFLAGKFIALSTATLSVSPAQAAEGLQLGAAALTGMMSVLLYRILYWGKANRHAIIVAMLLFCLHPNFYIMSGSANNDNLMIFFVIAALFLTLRWYQEQSWKHTLLLALAIGCGMMTKLSAFLIAPLTAIVFLVVLVRAIGRKDGTVGALIKKFAAFGAVCIPLGLWYPVYAHLRFDMPFGWIPGPGESQYVGNYSLLQRLFSIPAEQFQFLPYCFSGADYNIPMYVAKCSLFGEYRYTWPDLPPTLLVYLNLALMALSVAALIYVVMAAAEQPEISPLVYMLYGAYIIHLFGYLMFCFSMPYICTMDFRYAVITLLGGAALIGLAADFLNRGHPKLWRYLRYPVYGLIGAFVLLSQYLYLTMP